MRAAGLLDPQRSPGCRKPRPHDGSIIPDAPNLLWGTDATMAFTKRDGGCGCSGSSTTTTEAWTTLARRGHRFAALVPL